jgi:hypothetical protein
VSDANCSCAIGQSGACGHITALLYQLVQFKMLGLKAVPEDVAKTSQPQTWHQPRGQKIEGAEVQTLKVLGHSTEQLTSNTAPKPIKSTLYNPIRGGMPNPISLFPELEKVAPNFLVLPMLTNTPNTFTETKYGKFPHGSVLSYQQRLDSDYILNVFDDCTYPYLPVVDCMINNVNFVLSYQQFISFEGIQVNSRNEVHLFEEQTRLQSGSPLWFKLRKTRVTASHVGEIFKRKKEAGPLVERLRSTHQRATAAMRAGILSEPKAAQSYCSLMKDMVNLYPSGIIISPSAPWLAASPDRKVYNPARDPKFGLLEIKCPQGKRSVEECDYLEKLAGTGELKLKRNHNYYYQVLTQLAVTGLVWCDFFVWSSNDHHMETIYFDQHIWQTVKDKIDKFFFYDFLN